MSKLQKIIFVFGALILVPILLYGGHVFMPMSSSPISPNVRGVEPTEILEVAAEKPTKPVTIKDEELAVILTPLSGNALQILSGENVPLGSKLQIQWSVEGLSEAKGMVLNLVRDVPVEETYDYRGATGPLTLTPIEIAGANGLVDWETDKVGCAPTDYPTWCDTQPGAYYLVAQVYDRADFSILGWPDPSRPAPKKLQRFLSESFQLVGNPDLEPLQHELQGKVLELMALEFQIDQGGGIFVAQNFVETEVNWNKESDKYCLDYTFKAPFVGVVKACGNPHKRGESIVEVLASLKLENGVGTYLTTKKTAESLAQELYLDRVAFPTQPTPEQAGYQGQDITGFYKWSREHPEATTYLSSTLRDWRYHDDQWIFVYEVNTAGGSENGSDRFNDEVLVVVPNKGKACVVETTSNRSFISNYKSEKLRCP